MEEFPGRKQELLRLIKLAVTVRRHFYKYGICFGLWRLYAMLTFPALKGFLAGAGKESANSVPAFLHSADDETEPFRAEQWHACALIFEHALGGGANRYGKELSRKLVQTHATVLVAVFNNTTMRYHVTAMDGEGEYLHTFSNVQTMLAALDEVSPSLIVYNSLYAWDHARAVVSWMREKKSQGVELSIFLHDFYFLCPSVVMLDSAFRFCGVRTDAAICVQCLRRNFFRAPYTGNDIIQWRAIWESILRCADSISVPHKNMIQYLIKVYPFIQERITIVAHDVPQYEAYTLPGMEKTVIGVAGTIGIHKGSLLLYELADTLIKENLDAEIVVIGTLTPYRPHPRITVTGPYCREDLPSLLEKHRVTVALFPSICPETFSYVVHELMSLSMPIVSFALGAQGDVVSGYPKGALADAVDAQGCINAIKRLENIRLRSLCRKLTG